MELYFPQPKQAHEALPHAHLTPKDWTKPHFFRGELLVKSSLLRTASTQLKARTDKACEVCGKSFAPRSSFQRVCGKRCALRVVKKDLAARKEAVQPLSYWRQRAKTALHALVRERDHGKECISCDTILIKTGKPGGDYDAGHFRSVGSAKHLEMDIRNIHGQCKPCNNYKSGNVIEYERRLRIRCGDQMVDELLADNTPRLYRKEDYQAIEADCKAQLKQLKGKNE